MASKAVTAARAARPVVDKTTPAYAVPTAPANLEHAPITQAEAAQIALSPVNPLGTVKESLPTPPPAPEGGV